MYYYKIDAALLGALAEAHDLSVLVAEPTKDGTVRTQFATKISADGGLKEFASRQ
jgi:hypothetical protein